MSIKQIKRLCELQGTTIHMEISVRCPSCDNKTLRIDVETEKGQCSVCDYETTLGDMLAVYEQEELDRHRKFKNIAEDNKGVGCNY